MEFSSPLPHNIERELSQREADEKANPNFHLNETGAPMSRTQIEPTTTLAHLQETKPEKVTIVLLSGEMDKAMAAFIIATGASAMGMHVTMFFTFWGLNVIRKPGATSSAKDLLRKAFGFLNKGGADTLPLSKFNFGGLGAGMMKKVMKDNRMPVFPSSYKRHKILM